ncbi:hypothetical protein Lnau_1470 [Legionella nautarum]|uniref:Uncharacterized protein n=1 Tax=Legionella nautarum TaxID=45070 RepID=A0A0W0WW90_9GAMM|nr:hypothetical protein Lnau_1470 [Legionella nautarum]
MACVSKACLSMEPFAILRDSAARFLSANGINKTINELNSLFNVVGISQFRLGPSRASYTEPLGCVEALLVLMGGFGDDASSSSARSDCC